MADAIQDILSLTQAFGQFSESVVRLHQTRVGMETAAKQSLINKSRYDFLQRFNKPLGDPDRIETDVDSPNYWRKALAEHEGQVESYLGSVKNKNVQNAVRQNLSASNQNFAVELSNTLASAEVKETQDKALVTFGNMVGSGQPKEAIDWLKSTQSSLKLFQSAAWDKITREQIDPLEGAVLASELEKLTADTIPVFNDKKEKTSEYQRPNLDKAIEAAANLLKKPTEQTSANVAGIALNRLQAIQKQANESYKTEMESLSKRIDEGYKPSVSDWNNIVSQYEGSISRDAKLENAHITEKVAAELGKNSVGDFMSSFLRSVGAQYDKDGKLVGATKKILPHQGVQEKAILTNRFNAAGGNNNSEAVEEYQKAMKTIDSYTAEMGSDDMKAMIDSGLNTLKSAYKIQKATGAELAGYLLTYGKYMTDSQYNSVARDIESMAHAADQPLLALIKNKGAIDDMTKLILENDQFKRLYASKELLKVLDPKNTNANYMVQNAYQEVVSKTLNEMASGTMPSITDFQKAFAKNLIGMLQNPEQYYTEIKEEFGKAPFHANLNNMYSVMQSGGGDYGNSRDVYGNDNTSSRQQAIQQMMFSTAGAALGILDKDAAGPGELIPVMINGKNYITKQGWKNTFYEVVAVPGAKGLMLVEMSVHQANGVVFSDSNAMIKALTPDKNGNYNLRIAEKPNGIKGHSTVLIDKPAPSFGINWQFTVPSYQELGLTNEQIRSSAGAETGDAWLIDTKGAGGGFGGADGSME